MILEELRELIRLHPSISQLEIAESLGLDIITVRAIVNHFFRLGQINQRWTPPTLTPDQRAQRLDWSNFVLERSKHPDRFIGRFDTWIYKDNEHWTFDSNIRINEKYTIACFYTITGIQTIASVSDPRLLSSPELLDECLGGEVKEKRYLYVDSSAYNSARLLDYLHDRKIVLVTLPESSPDLTLGERVLNPAFWPNLLRRRFNTHEEGLKEYENCISDAMMGDKVSKMFKLWFERIQICVRKKGDYVEQIHFEAPLRAVMEPKASVPSQMSVNTPTANRSTEEPTNTNIATTDSCVERHSEEPKLEPKEEFDDEDEPRLMIDVPPEHSTLSNNEQSDSPVTGAPMSADTTTPTKRQKMVDGSQDSGNNVRDVARQQLRLASASAEDSVFERAGVSSSVIAQNEVDGPRDLDEVGSDESQSGTRQLEYANEVTTTNETGYPKPDYSYTCLCALAIKNSRIGAVPVTAIYRFMCENFPYFKTAPQGWKNSVRHNLSHNKYFAKYDPAMSAQRNTRRHVWIVDPLKAEEIDSELLRQTKTYWKNLCEAMSHPENLLLLVRSKMPIVAGFPEHTEGASGDFEMHNEMMIASQLEGSSASRNSSDTSQDDEI